MGYRIDLCVCKCGKIRVCGHWEWKKTQLSTFLQHAINHKVEQIEFFLVRCPTCLKNGMQNHHLI